MNQYAFFFFFLDLLDRYPPCIFPILIEVLSSYWMVFGWFDGMSLFSIRNFTIMFENTPVAL